MNVFQEQVDSAELDYELEKKAKDDIDRQFKKMEADVRMNQGKTEIIICRTTRQIKCIKC